MSESYSCNGEWVHFSNSACQALQLAWAKIAEAHDNESVMRELARALKERSQFATGVAAIGIDNEYLEKPFCRNEIKVMWLKVMEFLMHDIRHNGPIAQGMDVMWSSELVESWIERLTKLRDCLSKQVET